MKQVATPTLATEHQRRQYSAFISYSHGDAIAPATLWERLGFSIRRIRTWGEWLHGAMERYRIPAALRRQESRGIPRSLFPVFLDRFEFPSEANLHDAVRVALEDSHFLIVVCSPLAAASRWVNEEARSFVSAQKSDRIVCLIIDGEPNASASPSLLAPECLPEVIRLGTPGSVWAEVAERVVDARSARTRRRLVLTNVIARVIGVDAAILRRHEDRRRHLRIAGSIAAALLVAGSGIALWSAQLERRAAESQRQMAAVEVEAGHAAFRGGEPAKALAHFAAALQREDSNAVRFLVARATDALIAHSKNRSGRSRAYEDALEPLKLLRGTNRRWDSEMNHGRHPCWAASAFSFDGQLAFTNAGDTKTQVWEIADLSAVRLKGEVAGCLVGVVLRPQSRGTWLVVQPEFSAARILDPELLTMQPTTDAIRRVLPFGDSSSHLRSVSSSPDGRFFVAATLGGQVSLWDLLESRWVADLGGTNGEAGFSADGTRIATSGPDHSAQVWDTSTASVLATLKGHQADLTDVAFISRDANRVFTSSEDGFVKMWDVSSGKALLDLPHKDREPYRGESDPDAPWAVDVSVDGRRVVTASEEHANIWDTQTGRRMARIPYKRIAGIWAQFFVGDSLLLTRNPRGVAVWDGFSGTELMRVESAIFAATLNTEEDLLLTSSWDTVALWDLSLETRSPSKVAEMATCRTGWRSESGHLVDEPAGSSPCTDLTATAIEERRARQTGKAKPTEDVAPLAAGAASARPPCPWAAVATMRAPSSYLGAAVVAGRLYVLGGNSTFNPQANVDLYDEELGDWVQRAPLPSGRADFGTAAIGSRLYVIGGREARVAVARLRTVVANVELYDASEDRWVSRRPMPQPAAGLAAVALGDRIFTVGGQAEDGHPLTDVLEYEPASDTWTVRAALSVPRTHLAATAVAGRIYAIGGTDSTGRSSTVEEYDPETDHWQRKAPMPTPRESLTAVTLNGHIYTIGGSDEAGTDRVEIYDPDTDTWERGPALPGPLFAHAAVVLDDAIWTFGGIVRRTLAFGVERSPFVRIHAPRSGNRAADLLSRRCEATPGGR